MGCALEIGVADAPLESLEPLDCGQRAVVVANLDGSHGRCEQQLGLGPLVQGVGSELHLIDPGSTLRHAAAHLPEQPEDAEDVWPRRDVVGHEPTDGDS
jgi:hypothetical protein